MMTRKEQKVFVKTLMNDIKDQVVHLINNNIIPADWDGIELRTYLAEKFQQSSVRMNRTRQKAYKNAILTTANL